LIPIRPKPKSDEILSSWLIRCAIANGTDPEGWGGGIWNEYRIWTRDFDRYLPKSKAAPLCKISEMSYDEISAMTLEPLIRRIAKSNSLNPNTAWPWVIPTGIRNRSKINGLHFCPECLKEPNVYLKKQWRLSWNTVCPIHKTVLHLRCSNCHTVFSPHLIDYLDTDIGKCQNCGYNLRLMISSEADSEVISFQEILNLVLSTNDAHGAIFPDISVKDMFATLRMFMFLFHGMSQCQAVQKVAFEILETDNLPEIVYTGSALETASVNERHLLMALCARVFQLKIDEIIELFRDAGITRQMIAEAVREDSKVIDYLLVELRENGRARENVCPGKKKIEPKSKDAVERMMNEIRKYL
jgi:hypothetical protein